MRSASGGPRVLLRRLRETMAEQVSAQERLDKIVVLIAANMVAEVCSTYVLRVDNTLELYATEGLNREAVHRTVLSAHEGLVGLVADCRQGVVALPEGALGGDGIAGEQLDLAEQSAGAAVSDVGLAELLVEEPRSFGQRATFGEPAGQSLQAAERY